MECEGLLTWHRAQGIIVECVFIGHWRKVANFTYKQRVTLESHKSNSSGSEYS